MSLLHLLRLTYFQFIWVEVLLLIGVPVGDRLPTDRLNSVTWNPPLGEGMILGLTSPSQGVVFQLSGKMWSRGQPILTRGGPAVFAWNRHCKRRGQWLTLFLRLLTGLLSASMPTCLVWCVQQLLPPDSSVPLVYQLSGKEFLEQTSPCWGALQICVLRNELCSVH